MSAQTLVVAAATSPSFPRPKGNFFHVVMLQVHVIFASTWLLAAVLSALVAVPQLRRVPSAFGLHILQVRRQLLVSIMWATYVVTLGTGLWLLFKQAIYDPPITGSDFSALRHQPYGLPYYYALYTKIGLFVLMGVASYLLSTQAVRAAAQSEAEGGPVEYELDEDDVEWLDEEVLPEGAEDDLGVSGATEGTTLTETRVAHRRLAHVAVSPLVLWGSVAVIAVGISGVGFCVTLIKYFHELAKSAVVYQVLTRS